MLIQKSKNPPRGISRRVSAQKSGRLLPETPEGVCVLRAHAPHALKEVQIPAEVNCGGATITGIPANSRDMRHAPAAFEQTDLLVLGGSLPLAGKVMVPLPHRSRLCLRDLGPAPFGLTRFAPKWVRFGAEPVRAGEPQRSGDSA